MNQFYAFWLALLELNFVFIVLSLLHSQRRKIGYAPFYLSIGMVFLFAQFVAAAGLEMELPFFIDENWMLPLGQTILLTPYLAVLLLVYVSEGVLAMQRLVVGAIVVVGIFLYLGELTAMQCGWAGYSSSMGLSSEALRQLLTGTRSSMLVMVAIQVLAMFLLPMIYTRLRKSGCTLFVCFLGSLLFTQLVDTVLYQLVQQSTLPQWWSQLNATFIVRGLSAVWVSLLLTIYVMKIEGSTDVDALPSSSFEMIFAFFGGYGRSKNLEKNLLESEWRYQRFIESASEMVMLTDRTGRVIEANPAAADMLGVPIDALKSMRPYALLEPIDNDELPSPETISSEQAFRCRVRVKNSPDERAIAMTVSPFVFRGLPMFIVLGRDITEELKMTAEREHLNERLAHSQRLEAIGQLAGGVAHDFNNHIHAILGNVDLANMSSEPVPPDVQKYLNKIAAIAEQAGKVTGQLLGFARKGKYQLSLTDLRSVIQKSVEMLTPNRGEHVKLVVRGTDRPMMVQGDPIQLQQVLINLLINGRDAIGERADGRLLVYGGEATDCPGGFHPEIANITGAAPEDYWFVAVKDNGCGIAPETRKHIFEPFYTTKPVGRGTGMGLAMVYGTITNHHGWVQVKSAPKRGTTFYLFLPKSAPCELPEPR